MDGDATDILGKLSTSAGWDFRITAYDGFTLTIASGTSMDHAHPVAAFAGVTYFSGAFEFSHAAFQLASDLERNALGKFVALDDEALVVRIEAETTAGMERLRFYLVAESVLLLRAL